MIKVKETLLIFFIGVFSTGCITEMLSDKDGWRTAEQFENDFALWKNPGPLKVNGRILSEEEALNYTMRQQVVNGFMSAQEYNDWMRTRHNVMPSQMRSFGDPDFYVDHTGTIRKVPQRNTIEWMWYERTVLGTRKP
jgi:hypothetical protein